MSIISCLYSRFSYQIPWKILISDWFLYYDFTSDCRKNNGHDLFKTRSSLASLCLSWASLALLVLVSRIHSSEEASKKSKALRYARWSTNRVLGSISSWARQDNWDSPWLMLSCAWKMKTGLTSSDEESTDLGCSIHCSFWIYENKSTPSCSHLNLAAPRWPSLPLPCRCC